MKARLRYSPQRLKKKLLKQRKWLQLTQIYQSLGMQCE